MRSEKDEGNKIEEDDDKLEEDDNKIEGEEEKTHRRRRPGGRSSRVQSAVFNATLELLLTKTYEDITIAEIAARSGIHETSIYRRWQTKEALIIAVLLESSQELFPIPDTGSVRTDLLQWLRSVGAFIQSPLGESVTQLDVTTLHAAAMALPLQNFWQRRLELFSSIIERAKKRAELPAQADAYLLLSILLGPLYVQIFLLHRPLDDTLLARIVDLILNGAKSSDLPASPSSPD